MPHRRPAPGSPSTSIMPPQIGIANDSLEGHFCRLARGYPRLPNARGPGPCILGHGNALERRRQGSPGKRPANRLQIARIGTGSGPGHGREARPWPGLPDCRTVRRTVNWPCRPPAELSPTFTPTLPGSTRAALACGEARVGRAEREGDGSGLAGCEGDPLESVGPASRLRDARAGPVDVALGDAVTGPASGVGDVRGGRGGQRAAEPCDAATSHRTRCPGRLGGTCPRRRCRSGARLPGVHAGEPDVAAGPPAIGRLLR